LLKLTVLDSDLLSRCLQVPKRPTSCLSSKVSSRWKIRVTERSTRPKEIVVLVICATISGTDTFVAVEEFGEARLEWLRDLLPFEDGVPSHDVLSGVFGRIDPVQFEDCPSEMGSRHSRRG
jgi:hypothetical protein